jgi:rare lipoprotein A
MYSVAEMFGLRRKPLYKPVLGIHHMTREFIQIGLTASILTFLCLAASSCAFRKGPAAETKKVLETQTGLASFYGAAFHGKETASGETFDKTEMVAAHPSYPLGTVARVTNIENERAVDVRIIDRGPTRENLNEGVIIDLSKGAAKQLDFVSDGRVRVRVEVLEWGQNRRN